MNQFVKGKSILKTKLLYYGSTLGYGLVPLGLITGVSCVKKRYFETQIRG